MAHAVFTDARVLIGNPTSYYFGWTGLIIAVTAPNVTEIEFDRLNTPHATLREKRRCVHTNNRLLALASDEGECGFWGQLFEIQRTGGGSVEEKEVVEGILSRMAHPEKVDDITAVWKPELAVHVALKIFGQLCAGHTADTRQKHSVAFVRAAILSGDEPRRAYDIARHALGDTRFNCLNVRR